MMKKTLIFILFGLVLSAQEYCGTPSISYGEHKANLDLFDKAKAEAKKMVGKTTSAMRYVAVKPHVFRYSDGTGGLAMSDFNKGLGQINRQFRQIGIEFYISGTQPNYIDDDTFMNGKYTAATEAAYHTSNGVTNAVNVYCAGKTYNLTAGYSYVKPTSQGANKMLLGNAYVADSKTFPHEMGHYFGLSHTFGNSANADITKRELVTRLDVETGTRLPSNCSSTGDYLCDTPADPSDRTDGVSSPKNCVYNGTVVDANGDLFNPLVNNYMDYNFCQKYAFTPQQFSRMNDAYTYFVRLGANFSFSAPFTDQPAPANVEAIPLNAIVNNGVVVSWSETSTLASGYFIERATSADGPFEPVGSAGPGQVIFKDMTTEVGATYYYRVKPSNNPNVYSSASVSIPTQCGVSISNRCAAGGRDYINNFTLKKGSTILVSNTSSGCSTDAYGDFYNTHSATLDAGKTYSFAEAVAYTSTGYTAQYCSLFIDYNGDGDFDDENELIYKGTAKGLSNSGSFEVPLCVASREVRLRVITSAEKVIDSACVSLSRGEYEDYKIVLVSNSLTANNVLKVGEFSVYPNPSGGEKIFLSDGDVDAVKEVRVYSTAGQEIGSRLLRSQGKIEVAPNAKLTSGIYILTIKTDKETLSKKIIVR